MKRLSPVASRFLLIAQLCLLVTAVGNAQTPQTIGTVGMQDATVAGALEVTNGRAILVGSTTVTAHDHVAEVALSRGGSVRVCATSGLHIAGGTSAAADQPLMLALDRGAIEVRMPATSRDVVMTPDLRFTMNGDGPLELQLRVTKNGDTCVENRGAKAPTLHVADQFGEGAYELRPGQHVLFEHASLKEVVDHESSSCGCPPEPAQPAMNLADALVAPSTAGSAAGSPETKTAEEQHPFPAAISEGLAPPAAVPQSPAGTLHSQVSATLSASNAPDSTVEPAPSPSLAISSPAAGTATTAPSSVAAPPQNTEASPQQKNGVFHSVGRFFRRIFGGS